MATRTQSRQSNRSTSNRNSGGNNRTSSSTNQRTVSLHELDGSISQGIWTRNDWPPVEVMLDIIS